MKTGSSSLHAGLFLSAVLLSLCCEAARGQAPAVSARITQSIDEKNLVVLTGNVHPLARPEYDQGRVSDNLPLHRMLLLLQRGPDQEAALAKLLDDQQDKSSPNYHSWLTPQQFGQQFGPADADIQTVSSWLQLHGFQISNVTAGRTLIEFSGTAGQVRAAFHTEIHNYLVQGELHTANATDPQIPAALAPVVVGPVSLNNFPITSHIRQLGTFHRDKGSSLAKPLYTFPGGCTPAGCFALGPADFATIYNSAPLLSGTPKIDGTGQTIAIVGESDIDPTDVTDFQTMFGITPNFSAANNIIVNGADPGKNSSEGESDLDVQWSSAVAPGATIKFVTSEPTETTAGIFLSAVYIVENNLAGVMSESFGGCEQQIGSLNQFHNSLWQQAAAQGITVMLSAGDGGSAGCDNFDTAQTATQGLAVSGFASTPYNIAVGGTDFDEINRWSQFWSNTNASPSQSSALSYIPEIPWNDNCAQLGLSGCGPTAPNGSLNIVAGSGGSSTLYQKPSWQSGTGVPNDQHRDLPDVSLFASNGFDGSFYIMCQKDLTNQGSCNLGELGFTFQGVGGTSVAAPAFAGIMALVNHGQATTQNPAPRQGNANYVLYKLFQKQTGANPAINCNSSATPSTSCTFYDVTKGNGALPTGVGTNSVPCTAGSPNCSNKLASETNGVLVTSANSSTEAYTVTAGYDLVTGLGSVNIANLVNNWSSVTFLPSTTTLTATLNGQPTTSITGTHGTAVNVSSTVSAAQGAGTPSGQVALLATPSPVANAGPSLGFDVLTLDSTGAASGTGVVLPGGQYNLTAHYQGDGTFGSSDSTPPVSVNISAEPSKTIISIPVFDPSTGRETGNAPSSLVYGSPYLARIDVGNAQATLSFPPQALCTPPSCPTGTITWADSLNGAAVVPLDGGTFTLNSSGYTEDQVIQLPGGSHVLAASYSGDSSYSPSSNTYPITITQAPTGIAIQVVGNTVVSGIPFQVQISGGAQTQSGLTPTAAPPTGTITLFDGSTQLGSAITVNGTGGRFPAFNVYTSVTIPTGGNHTLSVSYTGDANYTPATSSLANLLVLWQTTATISASATNINYGQSITVVATITTPGKIPAMTGTFNIYGSFTAIPGPVTPTLTVDANGNQTLSASITTIPQDNESIQLTYSGDANFAGSNAPAIFINVNIPDFSLPQSTPITITAGQTQTVTVNVTPLSATPSVVTLTPSTQLPGGVSLSFSPSTVNLNGAPVPVTVTITTTGPSGGPVSTSMLQLKPKAGPPRFSPWRLASLLNGLVILVFLAFSRKGKRYGFVPVAGAVLILCVALGCGGGSSGGGGGGAGPVPTSISLTTSNAKVPFSQSFTLTATVTSNRTPTGIVNIFNGHPPLGDGVAPPIQLVNGAASAVVQSNSFGPGTSEFWAQYLGDANNLASQTTTSVEQVITGLAQAGYSGQTGGLSHQGTIAITLQ